MRIAQNRIYMVSSVISMIPTPQDNFNEPLVSKPSIAEIIFKPCAAAYFCAKEPVYQKML